MVQRGLGWVMTRIRGNRSRALRDFTAFLGRPPDSAGAENLRRYQLEMRSSGASATGMNATVSALRFFFGVTLEGHPTQSLAMCWQTYEVFRRIYL